MDQAEYEVELIGWLKNASDQQRRRFGLDLLNRTFDKVQPTLSSKVTALVSHFMASIINSSADNLTDIYVELYREIDQLPNAPEGTESFALYCLLDHSIPGWISYQETGAYLHLVAIGFGMTTLIDFELEGNWNSPRMLEEIEYQRRLLTT